jgi:hypothetical protein
MLPAMEFHGMPPKDEKIESIGWIAPVDTRLGEGTTKQTHRISAMHGIDPQVQTRCPLVKEVMEA